MKQYFFGLRILHENSLRLPFYFWFVAIRGFSGLRIFSHGKIKVSVRSLNRLCNWPINAPVQIQYTFCISVWNFRLQIADANWKTNCMVCSVWKQNFWLIHRTELKGHEHVANSVTVGINTCFAICFSRRWGELIRLFNLEMASK